MQDHEHSTRTGSLNEEELDRVLASRFFVRSPNLANILRYVCQAYLRGQAGEIKEYNIALQALGRNPAFDPSRDSIVRVEFTRLRKRLREYYQTDGVSDRVQICLPESGYVPRFVERQSQKQESISTAMGIADEVVPATPHNRTVNWWIAGPAIALATAAVILGLVLHRRIDDARRQTKTPPGPSNSAVLTEAGPEVQIAAGSTLAKYVDSSGRVWESDRYVSGGEAVHRPARRIYRTLDQGLYQNARLGDFQYAIPAKKGRYELHLHFAEIIQVDTIDSGTEGLRRFNVSLNGRSLLNGFDIVLDSGGMLNTADERVFRDVEPGEDGKVHLKFWASNDQALLCGIELIPMVHGRVRPVRILAGPRKAFDHDENAWDADGYFEGGRVLERTATVSKTDDPELFRSERFGNFSYTIPVAPGSYSARFYFAESNFGVDNFGNTNYSQSGRGSRQFDILCNGAALLRHLDILGEAHRPNAALQKEFHHLQPDAQGKLIFRFVPVMDYATVRAIEVWPE